MGIFHLLFELWPDSPSRPHPFQSTPIVHLVNITCVVTVYFHGFSKCLPHEIRSQNLIQQ